MFLLSMTGVPLYLEWIWNLLFWGVVVLVRDGGVLLSWCQCFFTVNEMRMVDHGCWAWVGNRW